MALRVRKKLIEVALPLEAINVASAREKQPGIGAHPRGLHHWWARRPQAAARAVIFAQLVDDPSEYVDVLRADGKLVRQASRVLKERLEVWAQAHALHAKSKGARVQVPEPGLAPTLDEVLADQERQRLFKILEDLVLWENATNEAVLQSARDEIWQSWRRTCAEHADHPQAKMLFDRNSLPAFHDPFAGGGALPLEAQRLGLRAYASDLNPVAVLINKAMIEIPPQFAGRPPVHPRAKGSLPELLKREWHGAEGLGDDVRYYGQWMREQAEKGLGHLFPKIQVSKEMARDRSDLKLYIGKDLTIVAWIWARTVKSPNPAFRNIDVPLASSFMLSTKVGKEVHVVPIVDATGYALAVRTGKASPTDHGSGTKLGRGAKFLCVMSGVPIDGDYIKAEAIAGRMGARLLAVVCEGYRQRVYLSPTAAMEQVAAAAKPDWEPEGSLVVDARAFTPTLYGLDTWAKLFNARQLTSLATLSGLIGQVRSLVYTHAVAMREQEERATHSTDEDKHNETAYANAVSTYLSLAISRLADYNSTLSTWKPSGQQAMHTFSRQALPMTWDYTESNVLADSAVCWSNCVKYAAESLESLSGAMSLAPGIALQADASTQRLSEHRVISTDPPYYDNVPYADLSDYFYVWLRRSLKDGYPQLFATLAVPKAEELVATAYRHNGKKGAEEFFLKGMTLAIRQMAQQAHPSIPITIYYAFKQSEGGGDDGTASTGWETFLTAVIQAGLSTTGTWPIRTELGNRTRGIDSNALASSVVLVCRKRADDAPSTSLRAFLIELKAELPRALANLQRGNIAPVDLAQAAIGPGMATYTRYSSVLDADGKPVSVREALKLINQTLDEALAEQEGDFDPDSRWALTWFEQMGFEEGDFGIAEQLSKSKNTSVDGLASTGILVSKRSRVRLLKPSELSVSWDPATDLRLSAWEIVHHMIRILGSGGEAAVAAIVPKLGAKAEVARELCYRLYTLCERKKRAQDALAYNGLVQSWPEIVRLAQEGVQPKVKQTDAFEDEE